MESKGGVGFYGYAGAQVKRIKDGDVKKTWNIASLKAGGWVYGEFPNPYYVAGTIQGEAKILKIINVSFSKSFEVGTICTNNTTTEVTVQAGDAAADQQQLLIQYVAPNLAFNFPLSNPIAVKYGLIPDEVFDVSEQQSSGAIVSRTFKMVVNKILEIKDDSSGAYSNVILKQSENNLGEFLYTVKTTLNTNSVQSISSTVAHQSGISSMLLPSSNVPTSSNSVQSNSKFIPSNNINYVSKLSSQYPQQPQQPQYNNLPPAPPPVTNNLILDKNYRFKVTATLKELNSSNQWVDAKNKNNVAITQTIVKNFRTGSIQLNPATTQKIQSNTK